MCVCIYVAICLILGPMGSLYLLIYDGDFVDRTRNIEWDSMGDWKVYGY